MKQSYLKFAFLFWLLLYTLLHLPAFQVNIQSMHSQRQCFTQNTIQNFAEEDFNILNPRRDNRGAGDGIFRMEFPIMQWLFAGVHKLTNSDDLRITRTLSLLLGILSTIGIFYLLKTVFKDKIIAAIGSWFFSFAPTIYYFTVCPMPDNFALCAGIWALTTFLISIKNYRTGLLIISGLLFMLSTAAKLPFILYLIFPITYILINSKRSELFTKKTIESLLLISLWQVFPLIWYIIAIPTWGSNPVVKGIFGSDSEFSRAIDYFLHHLISTLPENLVNYGALIPFSFGVYYFFKKKMFEKKVVYPFLAWFGIFALYFLFEINVIGKVHDYYFMPVLPMIALTIGFGSRFLIRMNHKLARLLLMASILIVPLTAYLRINYRWEFKNTDTLQVHQQQFEQVLPKDALIVCGNDPSEAIFYYYLNRKGWTFFNDNLTEKALKRFIKNGATVLISNSRKIDKSPKIKPYLQKEILHVDDFFVYELKTK